jgi:hypothetical protein
MDRHDATKILPTTTVQSPIRQDHSNLTSEYLVREARAVAAAVLVAAAGDNIILLIDNGWAADNMIRCLSMGFS